MNMNLEQGFSLVQDPGFFEYDSFECSEEAPSSQAQTANQSSQATPEERIAVLFDRMRRRRRVLLGIIDYLRESKLDADLASHIDQLLEHDVAVFDASNYVVQLERTGAIARYSSKGQPYDPQDKQTPQIVEINGAEFFKPAQAPELYWVATSAGIAYLEQDNPAQRLSALIADDAYYSHVYQRILSLCAAPDGISTPAINAAVNDDPLLQAHDHHERLYASYFTTRLESCDAIRWTGSWTITESGSWGLDNLFAQDKASEAL